MQLFASQRRGSASVFFVAFAFLSGFALSGAAQAADLYVAPGGTDGGACTVPATPCQSISYAIAQAVANDHINIAAGQYINPLTIANTKDGLQLLGEDPNHKPKFTRIFGSVDQPLLVINGAKNVHVENIEFDMDQTFVGEGILAAGFVDGLHIANNHFVQSRSNAGANSHYGVRNAISINDSSNSQGLARVDGSNVSITGNTIDGALDIPNGVLLRCGVDMDAGIGTISNNLIMAGVHDIRVRFSGTTGASSGTMTLIDSNTLNGRGLELDVPNSSAGSITISNNHINAIAGINDSTSYPADFSIMRLIGNHQNIPVTLSGNTFAGYQGTYRGVLIENFPGTTFTNNIFTPASNATDFVSLVVSNKELSSGTAATPLPMSLTAKGNTFNGTVTGAGRAVEFLNDNDAGGTASFGSLIFGGAGVGEADSFDGKLRWYFHLDDYSCDTVNTPCAFLDYAGDIGSAAATNTQVRPFTGNVSAADNTFAGVAPVDMTSMQMNALLAQTYDTRANVVLGMVDYNLSGIDSVVYVDAGFSGSYGTALNFTSPAMACGNGAAQTVYFGINAFATISDGTSHVQSGGTVCIAAGTFADNVVIAKPATIVGAGQGQTIVVPATYNPDCSAGGGSGSLCSGGSAPASVVMLVHASNVDISGLTVDGINPGLAGHAADIAARNGIMTDISGGPFTNFKVHDTTVQNIYLRGIYAVSTTGIVFRNNSVSNVKSDPSSIGIFNSTGAGLIDTNTVDGSNDAISANHSLGTTFTNNTITNSASGIHTDNNNDGAGGTADVIANNHVDCGVVDAYGIWTFVPYKDVSIHDNTVTACTIGLGAFGGLFGSQPIATSTFAHNNVDGSGALISATPGDSTAGAYLSTTTFYYGDTDNVVALIGNTFTGFDQAIFAERTGGKSLTTTAHFNRIVGNGEGLFDDGGAGTTDFINNWWGCNGGPNAAGCDSASGSGSTDPWLVMQASAIPSTINSGDPSQINIDLTHNSNNASVGTAFPDGTQIALNASRGTLPASTDTTSGQAQATLTGLTYGYSTVLTTLDNATVKLFVSVAPAATHVTVNDDTTGTNPDVDATCPTPDFNTITDAINTVAANTKILVCSGTYPESVIVNKAVVLKGAFAGTAGNGGTRGGIGEAVINPSSPTVSNGAAVKILADGVTFSGFTISDVNNTAIASGGNFGGATSNAQILDNRVLNVVSGNGLYTNGPNPAATNWNVSDNLFQNIQSPTGSAINLWKASGGTIHGNVVTNSGFAGIQVVVGSGVQITGNTLTNIAHDGIQVTQGQSVQVSGNTVTDANTSGTSADGGVTLGLDSANVAVFCNSVSGSGTNGFSTTPSTLDGSGLDDSGISVYHNAITVGSDISHNLTQSIVIGSNWYGGNPASVNGTNAAGAQVATALTANPIGNAACGNNTSIGAVQVVSGTAQTTNVSTPFAAPLVARVVDQLGGSIAGASVTFTPPGSGASASLSTPSGTADFDGRLSTSATANAIAGGYSVIAASGGKTAAFTLTNVGMPNVALTLNGPATAVAGTATPGYTAQLSNTGSALTENVLVDFVIARGTAGLSTGDITLEYAIGGGNYAPIGLTPCNTNQLCGSFGPPGVGFPVGASYNSTTALRFTSTRSGAISLSASVDGVTTHTSYASSGLTVTVGAQAANIAANGATTFTGDAGQPLGALPSVIVTDGGGNPASGVTVTFATTGNSGTLSGATQVTNSNGIATLGGWTLSSTPGTNTVTASASGLAGSPVTFTASTPNVSLTFSGDAQALVTAATDPYTPFVDYTVTLGNTGSMTTQTVHYAITVVRIDDGNSANPGQPMAIAADDVQVCVNDPTGGQADNKGCPTNWESLFYSESTGAYNGRPAVTFRYPINPIYDNALPTINPAQPLPGVKLRFKHGDYQMHVSVIGDSNGIAYAMASGETTVPNAAIAYNGATSGQAEDALLSQTTLTNTGGRVQAGNVIVRITLSDNSSAMLAPANAEFDYQLGASYQALPWTQSGNNLVTYFGPGTGFPLEDGHNATTAGRAIFHREGSYSVLYEVLDVATLSPIYASQTVTPITIGANMVNFGLSDLNQVYDGGTHAVTVTPTPSNATYTTVYEALSGSSCPAAPGVGASTTAPTNAGSYCVYVTATGSYSGSASGTLVVAKAVATVSIDGANAHGVVGVTYNGQPQVVTGTADTIVTPGPTNPVTLTYNGSMIAPTNAGSYSLVATLNDPNFSGGATGTLVVSSTTNVSITLDAATLSATFDGQPHAVTATTVPAGVSYSVTYVGDGSTSYPLTMTPPSAVGQYHVVATITDPNYDQTISASGTLTIAAVNASLTLAGDPVGAVADPSTPLYSMLSATTNVTGTGASENVLANLIITRGGGATAGDVDVDYRAAAQENPSCVAATPAGFWCPLPLIDNGDGTLSASFGPPGTGFPLTDGATSYFRTAYHRGGQYAVSVSIDGVSTGETYASGTQTIEVAQLNLHNSGPATGSTGVNVDTTSTLTNTGTAAISTATAAPNNENVIGLFEVAIGSGTVSTSDLTVTYLAPDDAYHAIALSACAGDPTHLCGEFGGAGFPVAAGYDATSQFRTLFTRNGAYTFNVSIVGASSQTIFATTLQAITIAASSASIAFDPASLNQVYNTFTHPVIVTTTPSGLSYTLTYDDGSGPVATPPTNAGDYTVIATITQSGYTGSASDTLHVAKANATVAISNTTQTYDGNPKPVTVTTTPSGLTVDVTYDGNTAAPSAVGSYAVVATVNDPNYTGSGSATLQIAAAPVTDMAVSMDARQYVQYGKTLTYRIAVSNVGNTAISGGSVTDILPPELDHASASWICVALGTATCTPSGVGDLHDSFSVLPPGGGVVYFLTAQVPIDAVVPTEQIVNMVNISASGDNNASNDTSTSTTTIVIFRDGFENGGDGAQSTGAATSNLVGSLDDAATLMLDPASAPQALYVSSPWLRATDASGREVFRIDSLRTANDVLVRVISNDANGQESHSDWIALGAQPVALALADPSPSTHALILLGAKSASLQVAIPTWVTLPLAVFSTQ